MGKWKVNGEMGKTFEKFQANPFTVLPTLEITTYEQV